MDLDAPTFGSGFRFYHFCVTHLEKATSLDSRPELKLTILIKMKTQCLELTLFPFILMKLKRTVLNQLSQPQNLQSQHSSSSPATIAIAHNS